MSSDLEVYFKMEISVKRRTMIFVFILVSTVLASMISTALTTALPSIMTDFDMSASLGQWLTSIYNLVKGISLLCTAYLAMRFPTKKLFFISAIILTAGLAMDLFANGFVMMMTGRILQGLGDGVLVALAQMILLTIYPAEKRGSVMGIYGLAIAAAPIVSPTLAGLLVDYAHWRVIFLAACVIMIIALIGIAFSFKDILENKQVNLDFMSVILCSIAFCGITLGVGNIANNSILSIKTGGIFILGVLSAVIFVLKQKKLETPFLDISVFKNKEFRIAVIGSMIMFMIMMASSMLYPLQLQTVCGYSATTSALVNIPGSLVMGFSNPIIGKFYNKLGVKKLFVGGASCLLIFAVAFSMFTVKTSLIAVGIFTIVRCLGISCIMMPMVTYSVSTLAETDIPSATSLLSSLRTVAGSIGSAVFVAFATIGSESELDMQGMNLAYMILAVSAFVLLMIACFGIKERKKCDK